MRVSVVLGVVAAIGLSGCATGRINSRWPFPVEAASAGAVTTGAPLRQMQIDLNQLLERALAPDPVDQLKALPPEAKLSALLEAVDRSPRREKIRDTVVTQLIAASTANCAVYVQAMRSGQVTSRLSTDLLATGFGLAGSLTSPIENSRFLSSLSAMSTATGASIDRNIFAQQGAEMVADSIMQLRETGRQNLERKMKQSYEDWPIGLALADVFAFHGDCSMLRGFSRMREAVILRDQAVKVARLNALEVATRGGSGVEVAAAVAGVERAYQSAGTNELSGPATASAGVPINDLREMRTAAFDCLAAAHSAMNEDREMTLDKVLAKPPFAAGGACAKIDSRWDRKFVGLVVDALGKAKGGAVDKVQADAEAAKTAPTAEAVKAAENLVKSAKKDLDDAKAHGDPAAIAPAQAALERARQANAELERQIERHEADYTGRKMRLEQAFGAIRRDLESTVDMEIKMIAANRAIALQYAITLGEGGKTADDVDAAIRRIGGDTPDDPALKAMYAAVAEIKKTNQSNGLMAARTAQAMVQTYAATFRIQN